MRVVVSCPAVSRHFSLSAQCCPAMPRLLPGISPSSPALALASVCRLFLGCVDWIPVSRCGFSGSEVPVPDFVVRCLCSQCRFACVRCRLRYPGSASGSGFEVRCRGHGFSPVPILCLDLLKCDALLGHCVRRMSGAELAAWSTCSEREV